ncbi:TetR/AcrR family transcriptional regulator [Nocardioides sp.]|uniref:TetR/AcrR family transcriptional regulator n=1 Tax=Nocardioides sp. TaxID=35761 RepID=UPI002B27B7CF|nr:TetR/AcrR family transcriptional regulator [Nocardioides sp.]
MALVTTSTAKPGARSRLSPEERRAQLLQLGVRMLATRSLDELSIDVFAEEAGVSRGLLYHYFGNKQDFHEAVVRYAADDLIAQTAPPVDGDPLERLSVSVTAYLTYVENNYEGYLSLVKGAMSGNETMRAIYEEARATLTDRIFREDAQGEIVDDTPLNRLLARGWAAMCEQLVLEWMKEPGAVSRTELLSVMAVSFPALVAALD